MIVNQQNPASALLASIVIPTRGRADLLEQCLQRALTQHLDGNFEILVCDDGSPEDEADAIRATCQVDERIRYLRQPARGPAAARNLGIRHARAATVVFLDSDTLPEPGWLTALLSPLADPTVIAVEGPVRPPEPATSPLQEAPRNEGGVHLTANMAYRKNILLAVGGLDESFRLAAFEDVELALSVRKLGKIAFAADALVLHPWRKVTLRGSIRRLRQLDFLLVTALRYGCLGWENRPTKHPRLRIAIAAALTMPAGRMVKGFRFLATAPADALSRIGFSFVEMAAGWILLPRWLRWSNAVARSRYL